MMPNRFCSGVNATEDCGVGVRPGLIRRTTFDSNGDGLPYGELLTPLPSTRVQEGSNGPWPLTGASPETPSSEALVAFDNIAAPAAPPTNPVNTFRRGNINRLCGAGVESMSRPGFGVFS